MSNSCFLDLQRAATALYQNPQGKTHLVFLRHARKILKEHGINKFSTDFDRVEKMLLECQDEAKAKRVADKILTLGVLIKSHPH